MKKFIFISLALASYSFLHAAEALEELSKLKKLTIAISKLSEPTTVDIDFIMPNVSADQAPEPESFMLTKAYQEHTLYLPEQATEIGLIVNGAHFIIATEQIPAQVSATLTISNDLKTAQLFIPGYSWTAPKGSNISNRMFGPRTIRLKSYSYADPYQKPVTKAPQSLQELQANIESIVQQQINSVLNTVDAAHSGGPRRHYLEGQHPSAHTNEKIAALEKLFEFQQTKLQDLINEEQRTASIASAAL